MYELVGPGTIATGDTAGFSQAYGSKDVGTGKTLIPSGSVTDGNLGHNYDVTFVNNTTGVITARHITVTAQTELPRSWCFAQPQQSTRSFGPP